MVESNGGMSGLPDGFVFTGKVKHKGVGSNKSNNHKESAKANQRRREKYEREEKKAYD